MMNLGVDARLWKSLTHRMPAARRHRVVSRSIRRCPHIAEPREMTSEYDEHSRLRARILREEKRLAGLDAARARTHANLRRLHTQLDEVLTGNATDSGRGASIAGTTPRTPTEKLALFRSLFRGRQDVYPTRFYTRKTGKFGYAPECKNKFVPGICGLPQIKCGECPNQAFEPVDDQALLAHLQGRQVMGVYQIAPQCSAYSRAAA